MILLAVQMISCVTRRMGETNIATNLSTSSRRIHSGNEKKNAETVHTGRWNNIQLYTVMAVQLFF